MPNDSQVSSSGERQDRYRQLIEWIPDALVVIQDGKNVFVNPAAVALANESSREKVQESSMLTYITPEDQKKVVDRVKDVMKGAEPGGIVVHAKKSDGTPMMVESHDIRIEWEGRPAVLIMLRDITDIVEKEEHLKEFDRLKSEFIGLASHQLRTPITSIKWLTDLLIHTKDPLSEENKKLAEEIWKNNERLVYLTDYLLNIHRMEEDQMAMEKGVTSEIAPIIRRAFESQKKTAVDKGVTATLSMPEESILVHSDGTRLYQALENVIGNAVKYTQKGGSVSVILSAPENGWTEMTVKDTGIGIPETSKKNIFRSFFRAENALSAAGADGVGLGLYLTKKIVEHHGGSVSFESELGKGTVFHIKLPVVTENR